MLTRLLTLAILLLMLPAASASNPLEPTPDTLGRALGAGLVSITYTLNPTVETGDVLPLCDDAPDVPQNRSLVGSILDDCFEPAGPYRTDSGPGNVCEPVIITIFPEGGGLIAWTPNEACIGAIQEWIWRILSGDGIPGNIGLNIEK